MKALIVFSQLSPNLQTMVATVLAQIDDSSEFTPVDLHADDIAGQVKGIGNLDEILADFSLSCGFSEYLVDGQGLHLALVTPKVAASFPTVLSDHGVDPSMVEARVVPQGFCYSVTF